MSPSFIYADWKVKLSIAPKAASASWLVRPGFARCLFKALIARTRCFNAAFSYPWGVSKLRWDAPSPSIECSKKSYFCVLVTQPIIMAFAYWMWTLWGHLPHCESIYGQRRIGFKEEMSKEVQIIVIEHNRVSSQWLWDDNRWVLTTMSGLIQVFALQA